MRLRDYSWLSGFSHGAFVLAVGWFIAAPVHADLVVMKNGDQITGEILEIWDRKVVIEPEYDDDTKVSISLDDVEYLESEREFEIDLIDGRSVIEKLSGPDATSGTSRGGQ